MSDRKITLVSSTFNGTFNNVSEEMFNKILMTLMGATTPPPERKRREVRGEEPGKEPGEEPEEELEEELEEIRHVYYNSLRRNKKVLNKIYNKSFESPQSFKIVGESDISYIIIIGPNKIPSCTCPSYEYCSYSRLPGSCKHIVKFFDVIQEDVEQFNWESRIPL